MPKLHQSCPKFVYTMPSRRLIVFRPLCIRKLVGEFVLSLGQAFFMLHCSTVFSENADNTPVFCSPSSVPELLEFRGVLISSGICLWPYIIQKKRCDLDTESSQVYILSVQPVTSEEKKTNSYPLVLFNAANGMYLEGLLEIFCVVLCGFFCHDKRIHMSIMWSRVQYSVHQQLFKRRVKVYTQHVHKSAESKSRTFFDVESSGLMILFFQKKLITWIHFSF